VVLGLLILAACEGVSPMTVVATINTNHGAIVIDMFPKEAPKTVDNFVTLSRDGFYDGVIFHRVIPNFMIQGGDPTGTGAGGPGYKFEDEFDPSLRFDKPGLLAMANSGPDTNGSQFFITTAPTPHLNNAHTIFGKVTQGQDVVEAISRVQTGQGDKPLEDVVIQGVQIDESSGG
jgi:peptidyl-prolyl cis-trans isomerase A (cyclophilin A)